ncbi:MAG: lysylphosphatidylglycerol synthase transmembrane domain-containing protein, partial [Candidatus Nanohaloarchaea archaeon]
ILRRNISAHSLFEYNALGWSLNHFLPARMGELVKAYLAGDKEEESKSFMLGTVAVSRFFDVLVLLLFAVSAAAILSIHIPDIILGIGIGAVSSGIGIILILNTWPERVLGLLTLLPTSLRRRLEDKIELLVEGFTTIESLDSLLKVFASSVVVWSIQLLAVSALMKAFGLKLPLSAAAFVMGVKSLSGVLPSSPGNIGTNEYFTVLALLPVGVEKSVALGFAVFSHAVNYSVAVLLGLPLLIRHLPDTRLFDRENGGNLI